MWVPISDVWRYGHDLPPGTRRLASFSRLCNIRAVGLAGPERDMRAAGGPWTPGSGWGEPRGHLTRRAASRTVRA